MARVIQMVWSIPQPDANIFDRWQMHYGAPRDAADLLAHSYGDVIAGLGDFQKVIQGASTAEALYMLHQMLTELTAMCIETEKQALDKADAMTTGGTAA